MDAKLKNEIKNIRAMLERTLVQIDNLLDEPQVSPEVKKLVQERLAARICLKCQLSVEGEALRGNHPRCYNELWHRVKDGEVTEAELIENGWLTAEKAKPGRKRQPLNIEQRKADQALAEELKASVKKVAEKGQKYERKPKS